MQKYVEVVINLPINRAFQYRVTGRESYYPQIGKRVFVPFRGRTRVGYIVDLEDAPVVNDPKPIIDVIDDFPLFNREMIELAGWISDNYFCSLGEALEVMIPGVLKKGKTVSNPRIKEESENVDKTVPHTLNEEQARVLERINACINQPEHKVFLLHGITGSGKTEVYLQAVENVLKRGKSAIMLVPEIALTPQTVERFMSRFGGEVAVFHSKMLESVRFNEWMRIKEGEASVVVGPRSAVFSPFENPGIFIVDEEHEVCYKQDDVPRYHAREVAIERARAKGVPVILGSATPSVESYYKALKGEYVLLKMTMRVEERDLPKVKIVDMRMEFETRVGQKVISRVLEEALKNDIAKQQQALVFLNRRGFSTFVLCGKCGYLLKCSKCDSPMVFHQGKKELLCHYCNRTLSPPVRCPSCGRDTLMYKGTGTEKIELELKKILPGVRLARMDSDTMSKRGSHDRILRDFKEHKIDIIVGTQMITKGLDFPKVTQVGVVSADANLNLPDFRACERTFNLITQVAGRAGRGDVSGEVIVQTYTPEHYAIRLAAKHDYVNFFEREIASRRELNFPPFVNLVKITVRSRNEDKVIEYAEKTAKILQKKIPDLKMLGPAPAHMTKLRGYYRWNILIKAEGRVNIVRYLREALKGFRKGGGVFIAVDVDPMSL